jgi:Mg2+/citrate symporter
MFVYVGYLTLMSSIFLCVIFVLTMAWFAAYTDCGRLVREKQEREAKIAQLETWLKESETDWTKNSLWGIDEVDSAVGSQLSNR